MRERRSQNKDSAIGFVELLLNNADKIWHRCSHYRYCVERFNDKESKAKIQTAIQYLVFLLIEIRNIFKEIPEQIQPLYEKVSTHVSKKLGADFIDNMKGAIPTDE